MSADASGCVHRMSMAMVVGSGVLGMSVRALADDHLLLSEVCAAPSAAEFIEIYNPLGVTIDLSNYFLSDSPIYCRRPQQPFPPVPAPGDYVVQFPSGSMIEAGARKVIALSTGFAAHFGFAPDFEFPPGEGDPDGPAANMVGPYVGAINSLPVITDLGEGLTLFFWNGASDLVQDVDIVRAGQPGAGEDVQSKSGVSVDGPDPDNIQTFYLNETVQLGTMTLNAGSGFSYKRRFIEAGNEVVCGGNGITGNQELSENIMVTWDGNVGPLTAPNPGSGVDLSVPPGQCFADINPNGFVDVNDLLAVVTTWGPCGDCRACPSDIAPTSCQDCIINVNDLLAVITTWGPCP